MLFTRFSEINDLSNEAIKDQLRAPKLQGAKGFIMSHPTRAQLMLQLQALLLDLDGAGANDLAPADSRIRDRGVRSKAKSAAAHTKSKSETSPITEAMSGPMMLTSTSPPYNGPRHR